jgi:hypothetical protein
MHYGLATVSGISDLEFRAAMPLVASQLRGQEKRE